MATAPASPLDWLVGLRPSPLALGSNAVPLSFKTLRKVSCDTFPPVPPWLSIQLELPLLELGAVHREGRWCPAGSCHQVDTLLCFRRPCPNSGLLGRGAVPPLHSCKRPPCF